MIIARNQIKNQIPIYCNYNVVYDYLLMIIIWDPKKARSNLEKHRISFEEAQTVLESDRQLILEEKDANEDRFIALGFSMKLNLLVVVYCYRFHDVIRIISARKATKKERKTYEERI